MQYKVVPVDKTLYLIAIYILRGKKSRAKKVVVPALNIKEFEIFNINHALEYYSVFQ